MNSSAIEFQYNYQNDENAMSSSYRQRSTQQQQQLSHHKEKIPRIRTASTLEAMKVKLNKQITSTTTLSYKLQSNGSNSQNPRSFQPSSASSASTTTTGTATTTITRNTPNNTNNYSHLLSMQLDLNDLAAVNPLAQQQQQQQSDEFMDGFLESTIAYSSKHAFAVPLIPVAATTTSSQQKSKEEQTLLENPRRMIHHAKSRSSAAFIQTPNSNILHQSTLSNAAAFFANNTAHKTTAHNINGAAQSSHNTSMMTVVKQFNKNNSSHMNVLQTPATAAASMDLSTTTFQSPNHRASTPVRRGNNHSQINNPINAFTPVISRKQKTLSASTHSHSKPSSSTSIALHELQQQQQQIDIRPYYKDNTQNTSSTGYNTSKAAFSLKPVQVSDTILSSTINFGTNNNTTVGGGPAAAISTNKQSHKLNKSQLKLHLRPQTSLAVIIEPSKHHHSSSSQLHSNNNANQNSSENVPQAMLHRKRKDESQENKKLKQAIPASSATMTSILNVIPQAHHLPSTNNIKKKKSATNYLSNSVYEDPVALEFAEIQMSKAIVKVLQPPSPAKFFRDSTNSPLKSTPAITNSIAGITRIDNPCSQPSIFFPNSNQNLNSQFHHGLQYQSQQQLKLQSQQSLQQTSSQSFIFPQEKIHVPVKREDLRQFEATRQTIRDIIDALKGTQKIFISQLLQVKERELAWEEALRQMDKIVAVKSVDFLAEHLLFLAECCLVVEAFDKAAFFLLQANLLVDMTTTATGRFKAQIFVMLGNLALGKQRYPNAMALFKKALQYAWFYEQKAIELHVFDRLGIAALNLQDVHLANFYHKRYAQAIYEVKNSRARNISQEFISKFQAKNEYDQAQLTPIVMIQLQLPVHYQFVPFTAAESQMQENAASPSKLKKKLGQDERFEALMKQSALEGENFKQNRTKGFEAASADKILDGIMDLDEMELEIDTPLNFVVLPVDQTAANSERKSARLRQASASAAEPAVAMPSMTEEQIIASAMPEDQIEKKLSWIAPVMRKVGYDTSSFGIVVDPRPSERLFEDTKKYKLTIEEKVAVMKKQKFNLEKALQTIQEKVISNRKHNWVVNQRVHLNHSSPNRVFIESQPVGAVDDSMRQSQNMCRCRCK